MPRPKVSSIDWFTAQGGDHCGQCGKAFEPGEGMLSFNQGLQPHFCTSECALKGESSQMKARRTAEPGQVAGPAAPGLGKTEALEKQGWNSWNARNNITPETAERRRGDAIRQKGLVPVQRQAVNDDFPQIAGNQFEHDPHSASQPYTQAHEASHIFGTGVGETAQAHSIRINRDPINSEQEAQGHDDENLTSAMEGELDRDAQVGPKLRHQERASVVPINRMNPGTPGRPMPVPRGSIGAGLSGEVSRGKPGAYNAHVKRQGEYLDGAPGGAVAGLRARAKAKFAQFKPSATKRSASFGPDGTHNPAPPPNIDHRINAGASGVTGIKTASPTAGGPTMKSEELQKTDSAASGAAAMGPSPHLVSAYSAGAALAAVGGQSHNILERWVHGDTFQGKTPSFEDRFVEHPVHRAFFNAGLAGAPIPRWGRGWRYGNIPKSGYSWNHRDQRSEAGVSMMEVNGDERKSDGSFRLFNSGRRKVHAEGWILTHRSGSDGEPLMIGARKVSSSVTQSKPKAPTAPIPTMKSEQLRKAQSPQTAKWLDRYPVIDPDHTSDLETRAAINEFHNHLPRHEAEAKAHDQYRRDQLVEAAAHHYSGMRTAHAAGDMESAKKHAVMYTLGLRAIGHDNPLTPPPEVESRVKNSPADLYRFKAHKADLFALPENHPEASGATSGATSGAERSEAQGLGKAEPKGRVNIRAILEKSKNNPVDPRKRAEKLFALGRGNANVHEGASAMAAAQKIVADNPGIQAPAPQATRSGTSKERPAGWDRRDHEERAWTTTPGASTPDGTPPQFKPGDRVTHLGVRRREDWPMERRSGTVERHMGPKEGPEDTYDHTYWVNWDPHPEPLRYGDADEYPYQWGKFLAPETMGDIDEIVNRGRGGVTWLKSVGAKWQRGIKGGVEKTELLDKKATNSNRPQPRKMKGFDAATVSKKGGPAWVRQLSGMLGVKKSKGGLFWLQDLIKAEPLEKMARPKMWRGQSGFPGDIAIPSKDHPGRPKWDAAYLAKIREVYGNVSPLRVKVGQLSATNMPNSSDRLGLYTKMLRAGDAVPPIVVERAGPGYTVLDGNHRVAAANDAGVGDLPAVAVQPKQAGVRPKAR